MRVLVFTLGQSDTDPELDTVFDCEADDIRLSTIELYAPEIITEASRRWPVFGDNYDEDRSYYIESRSQFIRYCESFGLEYEAQMI